MYFACVHICILHVCLVPAEARRGPQVPWNRSGCWEWGLGPQEEKPPLQPSSTVFPKLTFCGVLYFLWQTLSSGKELSQGTTLHCVTIL